ncbi:hypothetical protein Tco_1114615 [Tanacetum coccineum]|uniref:Uncharacterized protein n=1 Tax=Tanacetum coccineum TaxID=301880 RepID=A0ABQ5IXW1_9ASTR
MLSIQNSKSLSKTPPKLCSEKEDSNSETASNKSAKECSLNSEPQDVHAIKYKMSKAKERCMAYFRSLHSHLQVLLKEIKRHAHTNMDHTGIHVNLAFWVVNNQFQKFIDSKFTLDYDSQMTDTYFVEYTGIEVQHFRDTLLQHLGNVKKSVAERHVIKDSMKKGTDSTVQDDSSRSGNDTDADDADIRPIYDEEPMAEVQLTAECNIFAIGQQHTEQPEIIVEDSGKVFAIAALKNDLKEVKRKTDSTVQDDSSRSGNDTDADDADIRPIYDEEPMAEYPETCQVKSPMLDSSPDNQTTEYSKQSLESENILLKETVAQFQKDFSRMEAHCIALELKYQNQSLKSGQHGHKFYPNKTSAVYEKTSPRSDLRWKPTGRIFKSVGLRWIPTGKTFDSCTGKVDNEHTHGSNIDIPNIHVTMALLPPGFLEHLYLDMINAQDIERMIPPTPPRDIKPPVGSPISLSPSPIQTTTSAAPAMTQAAMPRKLVVDSVAQLWKDKLLPWQILIIPIGIPDK